MRKHSRFWLRQLLINFILSQLKKKMLHSNSKVLFLFTWISSGFIHFESPYLLREVNFYKTIKISNKIFNQIIEVRHFF